MSHYQGQTLTEMVTYILATCQKKGWDINAVSIKRFLNEGNAEFELNAQWLLTLFSAATSIDSNVFALPEDLHILHSAMMKKTSDDGYVPLTAVTYKEIQASLADDSADDVIEP